MNEEFQGLSLVELIDLLEEVPEPPPIPMTPQTPGWIVVGIVTAVTFFVVTRWLWRRWKSNEYRRAALRELDSAGNDPTRIALILRRAALVAYPRDEIAPLTGERWLAFLDNTYPGSDFVQGPGKVLAYAPYQPQPASPDLHVIAAEWLRKHKAAS